jgi:hypothetical protein
VRADLQSDARDEYHRRREAVGGHQGVGADGQARAWRMEGAFGRPEVVPRRGSGPIEARGAPQKFAQNGGSGLSWGHPMGSAAAEIRFRTAKTRRRHGCGLCLFCSPTSGSGNASVAWRHQFNLLFS